MQGAASDIVVDWQREYDDTVRALNTPGEIANLGDRNAAQQYLSDILNRGTGGLYTPFNPDAAKPADRTPGNGNSKEPITDPFALVDQLEGEVYGGDGGGFFEKRFQDIAIVVGGVAIIVVALMLASKKAEKIIIAGASNLAV